MKTRLATVSLCTTCCRHCVSLGKGWWRKEDTIYAAHRAPSESTATRQQLCLTCSFSWKAERWGSIPKSVVWGEGIKGTFWGWELVEWESQWVSNCRDQLSDTRLPSPPQAAAARKRAAFPSRGLDLSNNLNEKSRNTPGRHSSVVVFCLFS